MEKQEIYQRLDKLTLPLGSVSFEAQIVGCFACPDQWKTTDEANVNTFTYTARLSTQQFTGGKIQARQLTDKQIRQQQETTKKKPAANKKQTKDPAQQERIRKIKQQQAQAEAKRQQLESQLSEQERFNVISEDPYRAFSLKFQMKSNVVQLLGKQLVIFEQRVQKDGGLWLYVFKYPSLTEQELAKLKKGKPKNLNLNDLNPISMRAWVDLSQLSNVNETQLTLRCKLVQVDQTPQTSKPNLQKTYILLKIKLSCPIKKQIPKQQILLSNDLIRPYPQKPTPPLSVVSVNALQAQIKIILQSLAMEFSQANAQQLNLDAQQKSINYFEEVNQADAKKRNQKFLYQFNIKGMYKIMKQRVKKVIVKVCLDKFTDRLKNYSSFTGVSMDVKDQFYSQIYSFLISQYHKVLDEIVQQKKQDLHLTLVDSNRIYQADINNYIQSRIDQSAEEKIIRLTEQAQSLRNLNVAQQLYAEAISDMPQGEGLKIKLQYVKFCLRNKITSSSKLIYIIYEILQGNKQDSETILLYCLILFSSKKRNECKQGWIFLRDLIEKDPSNATYLGLANIIFETFLVDQSLSSKYYQLAQRAILRQNSNLPSIGQHQTNPHESQLPTLKLGCQYNVELSPEQKDEKIYLPLINLLLKYNLFDFVQILISKLNNKQSPQILYTSVLIELNKDTQSALEKALDLNQKNSSYSLTKLITRISFESESFQMCQQYLKKMFRYKETAKDQGVYLQLAHIYLNKGQLANSKACLTKLIALNNNNSAGWLMFGNVELKLGNIQNAQGCLRQANVLNPRNPQIWLSLCETYLKQHKMNIANTCLVNYLKLRKNKQFVSKQSIHAYLSTARFTSQNDKQIAQLMIKNIQSVQ